MSGDELKLIDWKVYGRSDRFFVKQFEEETNLRIVFLLDASGSMGFRGERSPLSKYDYAATLASSLAYLALEQGDNAGLSLLHESAPRFVPPRGSLAHLNTLIDELAKTKPSGATVLSVSLTSAVHALKKRSLIILLSDLLDDQEPLLRSIKLLKFKKHDVHVIHLFDREEKEFPFRGNLRFDSLENEPALILEAGSFRAEYLASVESLIHQFRGTLRKLGIDYHFHLTDEPLDSVIRGILKSHA